MLLNLGQGRAVSEALVPLACVSVLGSHTHHLRDIERDHERGLTGERVVDLGDNHIMCPAAAGVAGAEGPRSKVL